MRDCIPLIQDHIYHLYSSYRSSSNSGHTRYTLNELSSADFTHGALRRYWSRRKLSFIATTLIRATASAPRAIIILATIDEPIMVTTTRVRRPADSLERLVPRVACEPTYPSLPSLHPSACGYCGACWVYETIRLHAPHRYREGPGVTSC